jgi:tellurite resistance protein
MENASKDNLDRLKASATAWLGAADPAIGTGAMVETAFLMAAADGSLSDIEREQLVATMEFITDRKVARARLDEIVGQLLEALSTDGWEARIQAVATSLEDPLARRNAFRLAAGISFIDGEVQPEEAELFTLLANAFEIPQTEAEAILVEVRDELFPQG